MNVIVIFHFGLFFAFTPLTAQNIKILKKMKKPPGVIIWHTCTKNYNQMMYGSWNMVRNRRTDRQTDRWTDRQKKWHVEVGAPPKFSLQKEF